MVAVKVTGGTDKDRRPDGGPDSEAEADFRRTGHIGGNPDKPSVFISYSRKDIECAGSLVNGLVQQGYEVWCDLKDILGGAKIFKRIGEGISRADVFIPLLSPASVDSVWVEKEIYYASEEHKHIIPIFIEDTVLPHGLQLALTGIQYIRLSAQDSCEPGPQLIAALDVLADQSTEHKYDELKKYVGQRISIRRRRMAGLLAAVLILGVAVGIGMAGLFLSKKIREVTPETQKVLQTAYNEKQKGPNPTLVVKVMVRPSRAPTSSWRQLENGQTLSSAGAYFIKIRPLDKPAHVFVFQIDATGKLDWLFPKNPCTEDSSGSNPVKPNRWTLIPRRGKAFFLDKNLGVDHFFFVATRRDWPDLRQSLLAACRSGTLNKRITAPFGLKTRGVGGTIKIDQPAKPGVPPTALGVVSYVKGVHGALVIERWLRHVAPK